MSRFTGKVAIITGAGSGIGRATAELLAQEGASVTIADINADAATAVAAGIGPAARAHVLDVADPDAVEAMVADTVTAFGRLDVMHNNAAALDENRNDQDVVTGDLTTWQRVMDVNLNGTIYGCRFAIPAMLATGGGAIVNTASAAAFYGSEGLAAYGISKAAIVSLTQYVATAYSRRGIRCNAVAPGVVVAPEMQEKLGGPMGPRLRRYTAGHLVGRLGYPEEIAAAVAYLASDEAAFVTGETLRVDGGYTAHTPTYASDGDTN